MKKTLSVMLCAVMVALCIGPAFAAENAVTPTPPSWVPQDEYITLADSKAYEPELWDQIVLVREDALAGNLNNMASGDERLTAAKKNLYNHYRDDAGTAFEYGLLEIKYLANTGYSTVRNQGAEWAFSYARDKLKETGGAAYEIADLWYCRACVQNGTGSWASGAIVHLLQNSKTIRPEQVLDTEVLENKELSQLEELQQAVESKGLRLPIPSRFYDKKEETDKPDETVTPYPPAWVPADEYFAYDASAIYQKRNWDKLLALRAYAAAGGAEPLPADLARPFAELKNIAQSGGKDGYQDDAACFELMLLGGKLYGNKGVWERGSNGSNYATYLGKGDKSSQEEKNIVALWRLRHSMLPGASRGELDTGYLNGALHIRDFTVNKLLDTPLLAAMPEEKRQKIRSLVFVLLDGGYIDMVESPRSGRTMLPMRRLSEMLGATVTWDGKTQTVTLRRAADEIRMTLGKTTAYRNGVPFQMDVTPFEEGGSTYLPVRFVAELMGQKVVWKPEKQTAEILEDKTPAGISNLENWALPMGAVLNAVNEETDITLFGAWPRCYERYVYTSYHTASELITNSLLSAWGISSRAELIDTVRTMTNHGHNDSFLESAAYIDSLSDAEYRAVLQQAQGADIYMFPYTKQLAQKWGKRGIECWDFFRMSNLAQWGYVAGYVTYPEALALVEPAARALKADFSSWEQAYENYLDGYNWWARNDLQGQDIWETERGVKYRELSQDKTTAAIFDDSLFRKEIIPVPGVTIDDLK